MRGCGLSTTEVPSWGERERETHTSKICGMSRKRAIFLFTNVLDFFITLSHIVYFFVVIQEI